MSAYFLQDEKQDSDFPTPKRNNDGLVSCSFNHFAEGAERYAYKGVVNRDDDPFKFGDKVVVKKFIKKHSMNAQDWDLHVKAELKSQDFVKIWNAKKLVNKEYVVTQSTCMVTTKASLKINDTGHSKHLVKGEYCVVEPWLGDDFEKWNSNTGFATAKASSVHAFCHFTYHQSNGKYLFCDAQGTKKDKKYYITDPCILTNGIPEFGITDIGQSGIWAWFSRHECNQFCDKEWKKPSDMEMYIGKKQWPNAIKSTCYTWNMNDHSTIKNSQNYAKTTLNNNNNNGNGNGNNQTMSYLFKNMNLSAINEDFYK